MTIVWVHGSDFRVLPDQVPPVARLSLRELRAIRDAQDLSRWHLTLLRREPPAPPPVLDRLSFREALEYGLRVDPLHVANLRPESETGNPPEAA